MSNLIDNHQIRVFISSTFQDMQDERDYLMKRTFPMLRKLAAERDVTLTELDLRWGITEEEAKTGKVVEICLREIENSIPFFIGIIGNRYGWVPEKKDIGENVTDRFKDVNSYLERHLSVTEMEMQFGVLQRKENMHAYFYIKEGEEKENADNPEMLESLKKEVKASRYPSATYSSPENLGVQVEQAFRTLLDQLFPKGHLSELEKERIGQRSFMRQLCQNYIRDDKNFQVLDDWMSDWTQHQLVVTGASGLGKSALIANWLRDKLSDENRDYNIIYHFTGNGGSESSHEHIMKVLTDEINDVYNWKTEEDNSKQRDDKLNDLFIKVASEGGKPLLIVIDAINQIADVENAKLLNWLPVPPKNIKFLFSTLEDDRTMEIFNNRHYPAFLLQPISLEQRKQLITDYLHLFGKKLTDAQIERIATDNQCENTLVLKTLLDELISFGIYEKLDERINYYLFQDTIDDFYQSLLQSYEEEYDEEYVKHILSLIAVSRNGLCEDEIISIVKCRELEWSQFYCAFSAHFVTKNGLISYVHQYIRDAVSMRYTKDKELFNLCRNEILSAVGDNNTIRHLEERTYQLYQLENYRKLHDLLMKVNTFNTLYERHPYELGKFWQTLTRKGYSILDYLKVGEKLINSDTKKSEFYNILGKFAREIIVDYNSSLCFAEKALEIRESFLGKKHPETAASYNSIGVVFFDKREYDKALENYLTALEIRERVLGKEHPSTADSYNNIGNVYEVIGDYDKAMEYHLKALRIREKVLGKTHPSTADSYNNIGCVYHDKSDYNKALEYYLKALELREGVLGTNHPYTSNLYVNLGHVYLDEDDYDMALEYCLKALTIREKVFGTDHPKTADSYNNTGTVYVEKREYNKALPYLRKALEIREKVLGKEHQDTAYCYFYIGRLYLNVIPCELDLALFYSKIALEIREKTLGFENLETADSHFAIGKILDMKIALNKGNDFEQAIEHAQKALKIYESLLGKDHLTTFETYVLLGDLLYAQRKNEDALNYYKKAVLVVENNKGHKDSNTINLYRQISDIYNKTAINLAKHEEYDIALTYCQNSLDICEKYLEKADEQTADSYEMMGIIYEKMQRDDKALESFLKVLKTLENNRGRRETCTAKTYHHIGYLYAKKKDFFKAIDYFNISLIYREIDKGYDDSDTLRTYNIIGNLYYKLGIEYYSKQDYYNSLKYNIKGLEYRKKVHNDEHSGVADSLNFIAWIYHLQNKYDDALPYAENAIKIYSNNIEYIDTLATIYQGLKRYTEALEQLEHCLALKKELNASEESILETVEKIVHLKNLIQKQ